MHPITISKAHNISHQLGSRRVQPEVRGHEAVDEEVGARVEGQQEVGHGGRDEGPQLDGVAIVGEALTVFLKHGLSGRNKHHQHHHHCRVTRCWNKKFAQIPTKVTQKVATTVRLKKCHLTKQPQKLPNFWAIFEPVFSQELSKKSNLVALNSSA